MTLYKEILHDKNTESILENMAILLSSYQTFYRITIFYHWNIKGDHFYDMHEELETLYTLSEKNIDAIAERMVALGGVAHASSDIGKDFTMIKEKDTIKNGRNMIETIVECMNIITTQLRKTIAEAYKIHDYGSIYFLQKQLFHFEQFLWKLMSWLNNHSFQEKNDKT